MDSIRNVTANFEPAFITNSSGNVTTKSDLLAYNDVYFKNVINKEGGAGQLRDNKGTTGSLNKEQPDVKHTDINNNEYRSFVNITQNNTRGELRQYTRRIGSAKRKLANFNPVPVTKRYAPAVVKEKPQEVVNKPALQQPTPNLERFAGHEKKEGLLQQIKQYKEDQLLSNPGGDKFFLNRNSNVIDNNFDQSKFSDRVGKDLSDSLSNFKNMIKDLGTGSEVKYFDNTGNIKTRKKTGLVGTVGKFFKDVASGLTLGAYTPKNEEAPVGVVGRAKHFFKKIFIDGFAKDVFVGVPQSVINVGEDALFAGLNLIETIPDAAVGHTKTGRAITSNVFDNIQVAMDFVTDIMPGGEASTRMKTMIAQKLKNINDGKSGSESEGTQYVRSTPFRKAIETLSFFMPFRI